MSGLRRSPLDAEHRALNAKLVEFGGWQMPISYPTGTITEHLACRNTVAVFDVSHLGTVRVEGGGAFDRLQGAFTNDLNKIEPGRAQYTHLCADDGSVVDDIIVWWVTPERFDVMPNASNTSGVLEAIGGTDVTSERAIIAVQGPEARATVAALLPEAAAIGRFRVGAFSWRGASGLVAGTGYTGEDGLEFAVPADHAPALWRALIDSGATPAGLGARDTLRLEAALPLHGHELGPGITPLQAGLGWVVGWSKPEFGGKAALEAERATGPARKLRGISVAGRRPPRAECDVLIAGSVAGRTTSGNFSPVLGHGIALGFLPPDTAEGTEVSIDLRGTDLAGRVVATPFVAKR
ncbi:MAG: glycine cleavage system aminomethyltransferase GcvT [Acidimicrobiales bacterium]